MLILSILGAAVGLATAGYEFWQVVGPVVVPLVVPIIQSFS